MISAVAISANFRDVFPQPIQDPQSYYQGVDHPDRVLSRNVIIFERLSRTTLQQKHLANRMHHRYVLMRVLKTAGVVSVDGQSFQLNEGDALLVMPYQFHHYIDLESDSLRWLFITFEMERGDALLAGLSYRCLQPDQQAHELWLELVTLWEGGTLLQQAEILPILDRMLTRLQISATATIPPHTDARKGAGNEWITQIEALIIRSVKEGWTFKEVAQRVGYSERHLRNLFEQQMGLSLREYRNNYQFHRAISLMRDSTRRLTDVAELSGFNSQSVFTRFIKRMANQTPRELSQQIREGRYQASERPQ